MTKKELNEILKVWDFRKNHKNKIKKTNLKRIYYIYINKGNFLRFFDFEYKVFKKLINN